jgi:hypothetical protein
VTRSLAEAVASCGSTDVHGIFMRQASIKFNPLQGSDRGGRWGAPRTYPVLYLGRPRDTVIVEAYRHLVDPVDGMRGDLVAPRKLISVDVAVTKVLDLRSIENRAAVGLSLEALTSEIEKYEPCQRVGGVAHQLEYHGIIAPAATGLGETLALFERHLSADDELALSAEEIWAHLPPDPRRLRAASGG